MKTKRYLTAEIARSLRPGQVMHLAYDDFNEGRFTYTHDHCTTEPGRFEAVGTFDYGDGEPFEGVIYEFAGPHRTEPRFAAVLCSGSGSERVFVRA